ncbi:Metallo-dependent phosphatase-like protein [Panaeolus papilionaceus]|nr:Metallo-dependent phosphatase-like protein [Panaeolus papilionaceus]
MALIARHNRRVAVLAAFFPILLLYLIFTFKLHDFVPSIVYMPTQVSIMQPLSDAVRHKFWPWTAKLDESLPPPTPRKTFTRHIVAVGDLHGDYGNARRVLHFSGVTDKDGDWSGNVDFFVQTGDIIDRGDDTIKLYVWMDKLRAQAQKTGGTVLSLLGNHEWMNAIGDWRFVYPSELKTFGTIAARQRILSTGRIGRTWANNYTTASRLPLHPSLGHPNAPYPPSGLQIQIQKDEFDEVQVHLNHDNYPLSHAALSFVHGGLAPDYPELTPFPTRINDVATSLLSKVQNRRQPAPHPPHAYPGLPVGTTPEEHRLYDASGPLWYRGWAMDEDSVVCAKVDDVLQRTGTRRMIMGHTPDFTNIVSRCNGKIIIIDTGISHAYGGVLSALSIHYKLEPIGDEQVGENQRWIETEVVSALYPDRREVLATEEREVVGSIIHQLPVTLEDTDIDFD